MSNSIIDNQIDQQFFKVDWYVYREYNRWLSLHKHCFFKPVDFLTYYYLRTNRKPMYPNIVDAENMEKILTDAKSLIKKS